jgi:A1 cistron-splicing factor AAR2
MDKLSPDQAQALWDAGGFIILSDLPEGSEFGIDGTQVFYGD